MNIDSERKSSAIENVEVSDEVLIARFQEGDNYAFDLLVKRYKDPLLNFVYRFLGERTEAEDIVQDAFIKLWDNCSKIVFEKAKSFLYTVARNNFLNEVAHKKIVLQHQSNYKNDRTNESPEFLLEEKQFMEKLERVIADKKKYAEIAEMLDISVKAVEKRMSQALLILREKIDNNI